MLTAIVGVNWGDEGKGRMVDLFSERYGIVVRYQGGNNAGHTVVNDRGRFILNLMPSGILRAGTVNVLGPGMVIDLEHLCAEAARLRQGGIQITPETLKISGKATICMPYHKLLDCLEEDRLAGKKFGSTRRGIAPVYADKYMKKTLRMEDLLELENLSERVGDIAEWKNLTVSGGYGHEPVQAAALMDWLRQYGAPWRDYICDTTEFLDEAAEAGRDILFEAQLGALRDIDYGIFPYTSSSSTIAAYAPIGAGIPGRQLDETIGIMKAYSSCVGEGPFTCHRPAPPCGRLRRGGQPLRGENPGLHLPGPDQAGCAERPGPGARVRSLRGGREADGQLPHRPPSGPGRAGIRVPAGLWGRVRLPEAGGPAPGGPGLCGISGEGGGLPYQVCVRGPGAGRVY